ncbi:MAG: quinone-dependent dihydroorotate dehydrogenase [Alphaproteobacteria bacterium]|nr:quinone-dependent dihydroorotate dehydrogenase [Alphaproteobacteria bacterium]
MLAAAAMPLLRRLDAERAHAIALRALRLRRGRAPAAADDPRLAVRALGLGFANPIGLAAGFDKNAVALPGLMRLGFGFLEAGTVTPRPQPGNPRPRIFRLEADGAVINRLGFNNAGITAFVRHLAARPRGVPVGANVGPNREGAVPERDYPALVAAVAPHADYVVINVSSPNTPGLRDLQAAARLGGILEAIRAAVPHHPPLLIKLAPDLAATDLAPIVALSVEAGVAGLVVANTTLARPGGLRSRHAGEAGGLSGAPLFAPSTAMLAAVARLAAGRLVLIGVGGIATGRQVLEKIRAGASLVQLYTGFALHGPALIPRLKRELLAALDEDGFPSVVAAIGADLGS